jgi:hypothetical protein
VRISVPAQDADGNRLPNVTKEVEVGGGVMVRLEGTRYLTTATVIALIDDDHIKIRGIGFEAVVNTAAVADCTDRVQQTYQNAVDRTLNGKGEPVEVDAAWKNIPDDEWKQRLGK